MSFESSFFYSGLARRKSALSLIWLSVMATAVTTFQWFFWGYSLTFSHTAGPFIGNLANFGFKDVLAQPSVGSSRIPDLLFAIYQGMFSAITVALASGAVAERGRMLPCVIFMFIWATLHTTTRSPAGRGTRTVGPTRWEAWTSPEAPGPYRFRLGRACVLHDARQTPWPRDP